MRNRSNVWVYGNRSNGYAVKSEGADKATSRHETQREAISVARRIARNRGTRVIVQNATNGQIRG